MAGTCCRRREYRSYYQSQILNVNFERLIMFKITIDYPDTFPDALGKTREQFEQTAKWAMAVKLFELKQLSSGMAATLLGVSRTTFLLKLADYGVPMIDLTEEELQADLDHA